KAAQILAVNFLTMDHLQQATFEELIAIDEIGDIMADSIVQYFSEEKVIDLLAELRELNLNMEYTGPRPTEQVEETIFTDKTVVITGKMESYTRKEIQEIIEANGGSVTGSVSGNTDLVIAGEAAGSKYDRAVEREIEIWTEQDFNDAIERV